MDSHSGGEHREMDASFWRRAIPAIIGVALFAIFVVQNAEPVDVEFLWWSVSTSRIVLLLAAAVAGALIWELLRVLVRRRRSG